ncbi:hypothetical protein ACFSCX_15530 [Bacillus salitolerans]|uniref:Group-specific protein n=1 Tax=Bacillus salitolerans TaxID=1437434 RepID=A0ABW4LS88_9BACI
MVILLSSLGVLLLVGGFFATITLAGKSDQNYQKSTKGNVTRLLSLYIILLVLVIIGFSIYLFY